MPLNSHSYLVAQGWKGTGKALREGAINRPVIIAQKKTLAGVGRDRDEAFPFWDHVFTVTATSINVRLCNEDDNESTDTPLSPGSSTPLDRTPTGILSNKPQKVGLSALETSAELQSTRLSIVALAKREAARRALYSRFFRGPALSPDAEAEVPPVPGSSLRRTGGSGLEDNPPSVTKGGNEKRKYEEDEETGAAQKNQKSKKKCKPKDERKERRKLKRLKQTEKGRAPEVVVDDDDETGLAKTSENPVQDGSAVRHFHKKRKRDGKLRSKRVQGT